MAEHEIKLQSSDGDIFDVDLNIAKQFITIKTMLEGMKLTFNWINSTILLTDLGINEDEEVIPLPNVDSFILRKVNFFKGNCYSH